MKPASRARTSSRRIKLDINPTLKLTGEGLFIYAIAGGVIWYESRGLHLARELSDLASANLSWFVPATAVAFLLWYLGENLLFARMFTHFHGRTEFTEVLPATAAQSFLQAVNSLVADGALLFFLHQRKGVPWLTGIFTIAFFGFLDGILFSFMVALAGIAVPDSAFAAWWHIAAGAFAVFILIAAWWMWREPVYGFERWLRSRPSLIAFRKANLAIYAELLAIRFAIALPQGFLLWVSLKAFNLNIPLLQVIATSPAILASGGAPMTPAGLGPLQAVGLYGLGAFAPRSRLMAALLAFGIAHLLYRLPLGLGSAGVVVGQVLRSGGELEQEPELLADQSSPTA
jgi:uncharacterized membrane protein YbhN (UPF0104 family)